MRRFRRTCELSNLPDTLHQQADKRRQKQYEILHERKLIEGDLQQLKLALSDQNLELLPDYEQRVDVLKSLQFIDDNATVLLKGRVACEVRPKRRCLIFLANLTPDITIDQLFQRTCPDRVNLGEYLDGLHGRGSRRAALRVHLC